MANNRGGVFIDTSTPATREVGQVTAPERTDSTINVEDVGLVITLRLVVAKAGNIEEVTIISLVDLSRDAICSIDDVGGGIALVSSVVAGSPTGSDW